MFLSPFFLPRMKQRWYTVKENGKTNGAAQEEHIRLTELPTQHGTEHSNEPFLLNIGAVFSNSCINVIVRVIASFSAVVVT